MDYKNLVDQKVAMLFRKVNSLLIDAKFVLKANESFDFGSATTIAEDTSVVTVRALIAKTDHKQDVTKRQLIFQDIIELDIYDKVILPDGEWSLGITILDNGFTQIVEVVRG